MQYLLKQDPDFKDMPDSLRATVPAAGVQVHAVKALLGELRGGLQRVKSEIMAAMLEGSGAHEVFSRKMVPFHAAAEREFAGLEEFELAVYGELKSLAEYFGEDYSSSDPTRILRTVRDFMRLYHRAIADIEVCTGIVDII